MKTHKDLYEFKATKLSEEELAEIEFEKHHTNLWKQTGILLLCTIVLVFVSEVLVDSLQAAIQIAMFVAPVLVLVGQLMGPTNEFRLQSV